MNDIISRQAAIDTEGLDEEIRCEMCRNPMHTDRGCDGGCTYDEKLYKRIMQILDERIKPLPSAQSEIIRCKDCGHFHYDMPYVIQGVPVLGHEVCDFWGDGCKTSENGYCSFAERREDERPES